jgi:hypothetical protein
MLTGMGPKLLRCLLALGLLAHLPALWVGFLADDHAQRLALRAAPDSVGGLAPLDLYDFGSAAEPGTFQELPWWTAQDWSVRFLRPVTSLSRWLDHLLFGDLAVLHHWHSLALFGLLLLLLWRLYGRLGLDPRTRWLALALFAVDESTVVPVAWLANRNSLLEALCAAGALLCASARPARPLLALLLAALATLSKESGLLLLLVVPLVLPRTRGTRPWASLLGWALALAYLGVYWALERGANSRFYPEPWEAPLDALLRAPGFLLQALAALWTPFAPDLSFYRPDWAIALRLLAAPLAALWIWLLWSARRHLPAQSPFLLLLLLATLAPQVAAPESNRLLLLPAAIAAPLLASALLARPAKPLARGALWLALPLSALSSLSQGLLLVVFGQESRRFVAEVAEWSQAQQASSVILLSLPNPLVGLTPAAELRLDHNCPVQPAVLQLGARGLELLGLPGGGLALRARGPAFAAAPMEQVFRSPGQSLVAGSEQHRGQLRFVLREVEPAPAPAGDGVRCLELWPAGDPPLLLAFGQKGLEVVAWPSPGEGVELPPGEPHWPLWP